MTLATVILKDLLIPKLVKDDQFVENKISELFFKSFASALCDFENDAKPIYALLYSLELKDTEKIISKLDIIYTAFIKELAENHVLRYSSEICNKLLNTKNHTFEKEVNFFNNLEKVIRKVERKRISDELATSYDKLTFEVEESIITNAIKKTSREELKKKMMNWDNELESQISYLHFLCRELK